MFTLSRDRDGTPLLRYAHLTVPVEAGSLDELIRERRLRVPKGIAPSRRRSRRSGGAGALGVDPSFALRAIEAALGSVGGEILSTEARKRRLLWFFQLASTPVESTKGVA